MVQSTTENSAPSLIVFNSLSNPTSSPSNEPILTSWQNGPQKLTGFVKRGRPRKHDKTSVTGARNKDVPMEESIKSRFDFVNYSETVVKPEAQVRKAIRSHAMLDYRRRERDSKRKCKEGQERNRKAPDRFSTNELVKSRILPAYGLPNEIIDADPFDVFPVRMKPYMLANLKLYSTALYEIMYTIERCAGYNPVEECWIPMAFSEPALLHSIMFCADRIRTDSKGLKEGPIAVEHLRSSINCVNEKLLAPVPNITDATIVVVCTLAHTEKLHGNVENWKIHMEGLKQMVRLRGGLEAFESNRQVRSKIYRADLCGSIDTCQAAQFKFSRDVPAEKSLSFDGVSRHYDLDPQLLQILCQIQTATSTLIAVQQKQIAIHPLTLREDITSIQYGLLSFRSLRSDTRDYVVHELMRLGLLLYLVTLVNEALPGTSTSDKLCARIASHLEDLRLDYSLTYEFKLWIVFIGASITANFDTKTYFVTSATEIMNELGLITWEDVAGSLKRFFWVEDVHGVSLKRIWVSLQS